MTLPTFHDLKSYFQAFSATGKMTARTQPLIQFQNSALITKHFSTIHKYFLRVFPNIYNYLQFDWVFQNIAIARYCNCPSARSFVHYYNSVFQSEVESLIFVLLQLYIFTFFKHLNISLWGHPLTTFTRRGWEGR